MIKGKHHCRSTVFGFDSTLLRSLQYDNELLNTPLEACGWFGLFLLYTTEYQKNFDPVIIKTFIARNSKTPNRCAHHGR